MDKASRDTCRGEGGGGGGGMCIDDASADNVNWDDKEYQEEVDH